MPGKPLPLIAQNFQISIEQNFKINPESFCNPWKYMWCNGFLGSIKIEEILQCPVKFIYFTHKRNKHNLISFLSNIPVCMSTQLYKSTLVQCVWICNTKIIVLFTKIVFLPPKISQEKSLPMLVWGQTTNRVNLHQNNWNLCKKNHHKKHSFGFST